MCRIIASITLSNGSILKKILAFDTIYYHDTQFIFFHLLACVNSIRFESSQFNFIRVVKVMETTKATASRAIKYYYLVCGC